MFKYITLIILFMACLVGQSGQVHAFLAEDYPYVLTTPVDVLPRGYTTILAGRVTFYYANGFFYQKDVLNNKYIVVPPPIGAVVYTIPQGYQMMALGREMLFIYNGVYYRQTLEGYQVIRPPVLF